MIRILDTHTINQIAAGEVVENPAAVVKELVENSIDAMASSIIIEIQKGGISLIRVTDNGNGIKKDDVELAFLRHSTSKIQVAHDLLSINSLGFRGEALASIAAVSEVEIITKEPLSLTGKRMVVVASKIQTSEEIAAPSGTTFIIRNLFFNVPARKEFLKSPAREASKITNYLYKLALANPNISFKYFNNNKLTFQTNGNIDLKQVIFNLYGKNITDQTIPLKYQQNDITIAGRIGMPAINRPNRNLQIFFINSRYITSHLLNKAVEEAYKTLTMVGKFPVSILHINISPADIDVNVHPTKLEIRFKDPDLVYNHVYDAVNSKLKNTNLIPEFSNSFIDRTNNSQSNNQNTTRKEADNSFFVTHKEVENYKIDQLINDYSSEITPSLLTQINAENTQKNTENTPEVYAENNNKLQKNKPQEGVDYIIIGQIFSTYWLVKHLNKILLMDQHAAHEKVIYEKYLQDYLNNTIHQQQLIVPITINLTPEEVENINIDILVKMGFQIEVFGENSLIIREVPVLFDKPMSTEGLTDFFQQFSQKNIYLSQEEKIIQMACKSAIKGNNIIDKQECKALIEALLMLENPYTCPHGRPTLISLKKADIEKLFKRI
ncbi:MAG: hypothetical protein BEN19_07740 [Epulopiscium sp. Nuni2H_MBin003]|nr:MAG: hypothetical protein BEN19_07740 [Epulopiscium sp. Nuni2H_MBin003]